MAAFRFDVEEMQLAILELRPAGGTLPDSLTAAERAVALAALAGDSNAAIARGRGTSVRTVANQLASAYAKLGIRSRAELAARFSAGQGER